MPKFPLENQICNILQIILYAQKPSSVFNYTIALVPKSHLWHSCHIQDSREALGRKSALPKFIMREEKRSRRR